MTSIVDTNESLVETVKLLEGQVSSYVENSKEMDVRLKMWRWLFYLF